MIKLIIPAIILTILGSGAAYALHIKGENERLEVELTQAVEANQQNQQAIDRLTADLKLKESQIIERNRAKQAQQKTIAQLKRTLDDAKKKYITLDELACMESAIPKPVISFLRQGAGNSDGSTGTEAMPVTSPIQPDNRARF